MAAYHETHDAPHCPTCDCGVESLSRQGATRASESGDSFDKYDMHVTDDGAVVFTHNGKTAAIYNPIAAAPVLSNKDMFDLTYRRYMEEGGHSYDPWDIAYAWNKYQDDPSLYAFLFSED